MNNMNIGRLERKSVGDIEDQNNDLTKAIKIKLKEFNLSYCKELPDTGRGDMDRLYPGIIEELRLYIKKFGPVDRLAVLDSTRLGFNDAINLVMFISDLDALGCKLWLMKTVLQQELLVDRRSPDLNNMLKTIIDGNSLSKGEHSIITDRYARGKITAVEKRHKMKRDLYGYNARVFNEGHQWLWDIQKIGYALYPGTHTPKGKRRTIAAPRNNRVITRLKILPNGISERCDDVYVLRGETWRHNNMRPVPPDYSYQKLVKNTDATTVLLAFELFDKLGSLSEVAKQLNSRGLNFYGCKFDTGNLYHLILNKTYNGQYWWKGIQYPLEKEDKEAILIVPDALFNKVQIKMQPFLYKQRKRKITNDWRKQFVVCSCGEGATVPLKARKLQSKDQKRNCIQYSCVKCRRANGEHPHICDTNIKKHTDKWLELLPSFGEEIDPFAIYGNILDVNGLAKLEKYYENDNSLLAKVIKAAAAINSFVLEHKDLLPPDADRKDGLALYRLLRDQIVVLHHAEIESLKSKRAIDQEAYRKRGDDSWLDSVSAYTEKIKEISSSQGRDLEKEFDACERLYEVAVQEAANLGTQLKDLPGIMLGELLRRPDENGLAWLKYIKVYFSQERMKVDKIEIVSDKLATITVDMSKNKLYIPEPRTEEWRKNHAEKIKAAWAKRRINKPKKP